MTDGIIKGTGNSRLLRTVPNALTLYPDWPTALQAMIDGTFPIDLPGINPDGWERLGDKLGKETLLTDTLCAALGLPNTATPTQAMEKIRSTADSAQSTAVLKGYVASGSYVGTGTMGSLNPNSLTFSFAPKMVAIISAVRISNPEAIVFFPDGSEGYWMLQTETLSTSYQKDRGFGGKSSNDRDNYGKKSPDGKTISWYSVGYPSYPHYQMNDSSLRYYYIAIG